MSQNFPKPYEPFGGDINAKVDLSNYVTKTNLKNVTHVDVSRFELKSNLASLKTEVDQLGIDKLTPVSNDLARLSNLVKNNVIKKIVYDKLVGKVDNIDTTGFVLKNTCDTDKSGLEKKNIGTDNKIPDTSGLVKKTDLNGKITEIEDKMPDVSGLVAKTDYDTKISEIEKKVSDHNHDKYITTPEFNNLAAWVFTARLAQADLVKNNRF